jgi:hypothetical protein
MLLPSTSKETFSILYSRLVELRCDVRKMTILEPGVLSLEAKEGWTHKLYLENLWILCRQDPENARATIEQYIGVVSRLGNEPPVKRQDIIAWIRCADAVDLWGADPHVLMEHLAADLWIVYAAVVEGGSHSISEDDLIVAGVAREELHQLAIGNLMRILPRCEVHDFEFFKLLAAGPDFCPSLLLLDGLWENLAQEFTGDMVVVAPVSDSVFVTSSDSATGLAHIRKRALTLEETEDHIVSTTLLRRVNGGWKAFD